MPVPVRLPPDILVQGCAGPHVVSCFSCLPTRITGRGLGVSAGPAGGAHAVAGFACLCRWCRWDDLMDHPEVPMATGRNAFKPRAYLLQTSDD
jgi:hypothetical protein